MTTPFPYATSAKTLTVKDAMARLKAIGFTIRYVGGDYRVCPKGGTEDVAYYTDDLHDAVWTAENWDGEIQ